MSAVFNTIIGSDWLRVCTQVPANDVARQIRARAPRAMKVACAWCNGHLSGPKIAPREEVSHGICTHCLTVYFPEQAAEILSRQVTAQAEGETTAACRPDAIHFADVGRLAADGAASDRREDTPITRAGVGETIT